MTTVYAISGRLLRVSIGAVAHDKKISDMLRRIFLYAFVTISQPTVRENEPRVRRSRLPAFSSRLFFISSPQHRQKKNSIRFDFPFFCFREAFLGTEKMAPLFATVVD